MNEPYTRLYREALATSAVSKSLYPKNRPTRSHTASRSCDRATATTRSYIELVFYATQASAWTHHIHTHTHYRTGGRISSSYRMRTIRCRAGARAAATFSWFDPRLMYVRLLCVCVCEWCVPLAWSRIVCARTVWTISGKLSLLSHPRERPRRGAFAVCVRQRARASV